MTLPELCIKRPVFTTMLILLPVVLGLVGFSRMGVDLFPNVEIPIVFVTTTRLGASADEIETGITKKIEDQINTIASIDELSSTSKEGISTVVVRFLLEKDRDVAQQEVQSKINAMLSQLPPGTDTPIIDKFDIDAQPVMSIAVSRKRHGATAATEEDLREVTELADKRIAQSLSGLSGVGTVSIVGGLKRAIQISVDTDKLQALGLGVNSVRDAVQNQNLELPGGRVDQSSREVTLRTMGRIEDPRDFNDIILATVKDQPIRLRDVGQARDSVEEPRGLSLLDGDPTVQLIVQKQSGTNTVEVIDTVKAKLEQLRTSLAAEGHGDIEMQVIRDQSRFIKGSIREVQKHLLLGAILVSLTILLFLRDWRTMLMASISMPVSIIGTMLAMYVLGFTFNNITMLALVMSVGIVIDDAVVVHENIFRWMEEKGLPAWDAALGATKEIGLAVMATTFSLVVIFLPVAFMSGVPGRFIRSFGITMAVAIMVSLVVSFTLTPMLCSRFLKLSRKAREAIARGDHKHHSGGVYGWVAERPYLWMLRWSLRHRWVVVLAGIMIVAAIFPMPVGRWVAGSDAARQQRLAWMNYPGLAGLLGMDFLPPDDQSELEVAITAPGGWTLERTRRELTEIKDRLTAMPAVTHTLITIGDTTGKQTRATGDVTKATIYVQMVDLDDRHGSSDPRIRNVSQFDLMAEARRIMADYPDLRSSVQIPANVSGGGANADVEFTLSGPDLEGLNDAAKKILVGVRQVPGMTDVDTTIPERNPELRVMIDRTRAKDLNLDVRAIAAALQILVGGQVVSDYKDPSNGEQYDVWIRAALPYRGTEEAIAAGTIQSPSAGLVELRNVARLEEARGPAQIDHFQRQRKISIIGNTAWYDKHNQFLFLHWTTHEKLPIGSAMEGINKVIADLRASGELSPSYMVEFLGRAKTQSQVMGAFAMAFALSVIFMYMILASQFESFVHPITILLAVPLTIPFAMLSLIFLGQSMTFFGILGVFLLFGIVKKNGILQVDYSNHLRRRGMPLFEAVMEANKTRLRPILMTTVMLIASMMPIALGQGAGSSSRSAMAKVIVGGQAMSLLLTLLMSPVAYTIFDDFGRWVRRFLPGKVKPGASTGSPGVPDHVDGAAAPALQAAGNGVGTRT